MLEKVKKYLKITWNYEDYDLTGYYERGKAFLESLTGTKLDFETNKDAEALLFDYCRYAYNNALEYFETNFSKAILRLSLMEAVKDSEK